jgi:hypothetical protein
MRDTTITQHVARITPLQPHGLILILSLIITLLPVPYVLSNWTPVGDEPHYLLAAHSLARDGDLDLANNYAQGDYRAFYPLPLDPHIRVGADGRSYLSHDLGLPILIAPAYALGGRAGVIIFLAIIAALIGVNVYGLAVEVTGNSIAAAVTWLLLLITPVLSLYAYLVYPEMIAALIVIWNVRQLVTRHSSLVTQHIIIGLTLVVLPWLSARFIPIALFLLAWKIWRAARRSNRRSVLIPIGLLAISLIGYFAANVWLNGSPTGTIDFNNSPIATGFQSISIERIARGLIGWWLDQQRGLLIYSPVYLVALIGLPILWRRFRWIGLAVLTPLLIAYLSAVAWGGFWVGWEISARYLVVGLPLLAAPFALALHHLRGWFFRSLIIITAALALFNSIFIIRTPGLWAYRESIVALYDHYLSIDLWRWLPAISGGAVIEPDPSLAQLDATRSVWHNPIGQSTTLIQTSSFDNLTIGVYEIHFEARAAKIPSPTSPLLTIDVSSGDGVTLLHKVLTGADFDGGDQYRSFSIAFDQPFYNKWSYPLYLQVTCSGLAEIWLTSITILPEPFRLWGLSGVWLAAIVLIVVIANRRASQKE